MRLRVSFPGLPSEEYEAVELAGVPAAEMAWDRYKKAHPDARKRHVLEVATGTYKLVSPIIEQVGTNKQPEEASEGQHEATDG